ncbi:hypothetical protein HZA73_09520 [candidate division TA06 bacterium]|nr:hypothetical protein [candidate division TA06 bacterium]
MKNLEIISGGISLLLIGGILSREIYNILSKPTPKEYEVYEDRHAVWDTISDIIDKSKHGTLWGLAGEFSPDFYRSIRDKLHDLAINNGQCIFLGGPHILVEDADYEKYVKNGVNSDEYWKAHPYVDLAHAFPNNIKLYIKQTTDREKLHCFCSDNESASSVIEKGHPELQKSPVFIENDSATIYSDLRERFYFLVKSKEAILWNPSAADASKYIKYVSINEMKQRQEKQQGH